MATPSSHTAFAFMCVRTYIYTRLCASAQVSSSLMRTGDRVAAWAALLRVHAALVPQLDKELQEAQRLPLTWYDVLLTLNSAPGRRMRMSELGEAAVVSRTRVSRVVDELVAAGLVCREANAVDRRSSFAVITPEGRQRLRAAASIYLSGIERHFTRHLTDDEVAAIRCGLGRVLSAFQQRQMGEEETRRS
jgi:DNA-binding MarR family transcriptional regulator